jgi:hypothetical protein
MVRTTLGQPYGRTQALLHFAAGTRNAALLGELAPAASAAALMRRDRRAVQSFEYCPVYRILFYRESLHH